MKIKKILFTGGGSGGHVAPIIAVYRELTRIAPEKDVRFFFLGPKDEVGSVLLYHEGIEIKNIMSGKIRRYWDTKSIFQNLLDVFIKIPLGIIQSFFYVFFLAPDLIFSKGGFGSIPVVIASKLLFVPIFLHESDAVPGASNRMLSSFALEIFTSFPKTEYFPYKKMALIGNPIRKELLESSREEAKKSFNLTGEKPVILILGGSQGAQRVNNKIIEVLPKLLENFELIHQCGDKNFEEVKSESKIMINNEEKEKYYHLFPFLKEPELGRAYAASDLIVSRAGAGSVFEIAAVEKPSVLIPLPEAAQNHQVKNAYAYAEKGASVVIEESNFSSSLFLEKLKYLFSHPEELEKMKKAAKEFARPRAAKIIAEYIWNYLSN